MLRLPAFVRLASGTAQLADGRRDEADWQLARAGELFQRMGDTHYQQRTEALLAETA